MAIYWKNFQHNFIIFCKSNKLFVINKTIAKKNKNSTILDFSGLDLGLVLASSPWSIEKLIKWFIPIYIKMIWN